MLGGSFWVSFLRNGMSAGLMMAVFMLLEHQGASLGKTIRNCVLFWIVATTGFSFWYLFHHESFVRFAGLLSIFVVGVFCLRIGRDTLYLSLYKLTLGFYLLAVTVFCGIDSSRLWFGGNIWADIIVRFVLIGAILFVLATKVRKSFLDGVDYLREELDLFSAITVLLCVPIAAMVAYWPGSHEFSILHIMRTAILLVMTGLIQYMVFHLYLHRGRERRYRVESELLRMNERFVRRQVELMHQTDTEIKDRGTERICENETINNVLAVYAGWAEKENIKVKMKVQVEKEIMAQDIHIMAVIANIFENAIQGCIASQLSEPEIHLSIVRKGKKLAIVCRNSYTRGMEFHAGMGIDGGVGVSSVMKVVAFYNGEADFSVESGMFTARILLKISEKESSATEGTGK